MAWGKLVEVSVGAASFERYRWLMGSDIPLRQCTLGNISAAAHTSRLSRGVPRLGYRERFLGIYLVAWLATAMRLPTPLKTVSWRQIPRARRFAEVSRCHCSFQAWHSEKGPFEYFKNRHSGRVRLRPELQELCCYHTKDPQLYHPIRKLRPRTPCQQQRFLGRRMTKLLSQILGCRLGGFL